MSPCNRGAIDMTACCWPYKKHRGVFVRFVALLVFMSAFQAMSLAADKEIVGAVEEVVLLPWNIKLLARIDTGAAISSLDARSLTVSNNMAVFKLPNDGAEVELKLPVVGQRRIRHADGAEFRPLVQLEMCIGPHRISTKVNLNDRSKMEYPLLIGRNILARRFLVDVNRNRVLTPNCRQASPR